MDVMIGLYMDVMIGLYMDVMIGIYMDVRIGLLIDMIYECYFIYLLLTKHYDSKRTRRSRLLVYSSMT